MTEGDPDLDGRQGPSVDPDDLRRLVEVLVALRDTVGTLRYALALPSAARATASSRAVAKQLDDFLLPRLLRLGAPMLAVVGGSTGAGKSTLVNSLIGVPVCPAGVLRPTTRAPVLVCDPDDGSWFMQPNLLPGLTRVAVATDDPGTLQLVSSPVLAPGLALLDAPDIDSVVEANRALADQLLAAADLWLFVTTAARYADAVPWDLLRTARNRGTSVALVLSRVPAGAEADIAPHLADMLTARGLTGVPLFVLPESRLDGQGLLPGAVSAPLLGWLSRLARSTGIRTAVVRRTVGGAVDALGATIAELATAADEQVAAAWALARAVRSAYRAAESTVERGIADGSVLRGEVLARWKDLVGTGEVARVLQQRTAWLRERVTAGVTGRVGPAEHFAGALESGIAALLQDAAVDAAAQTGAAWRAHPAGAALLATSNLDLAAPGPDLPVRVRRLVRDWRRGVIDLIRARMEPARADSRPGSYTARAASLLVMALVCTARRPDAPDDEPPETGIGGTTGAAWKVLEALFDAEAVTALTATARADLSQRLRALLAEEAGRYQDTLDAAGVEESAGERLRQTVDAIMTARLRAGLPAAHSAPATLPATDSDIEVSASGHDAPEAPGGPGDRGTPGGGSPDRGMPAGGLDDDRAAAR